MCMILKMQKGKNLRVKATHPPPIEAHSVATADLHEEEEWRAKSNKREQQSFANFKVQEKCRILNHLDAHYKKNLTLQQVSIYNLRYQMYCHSWIPTSPTWSTREPMWRKSFSGLSITVPSTRHRTRLSFDMQLWCCFSPEGQREKTPPGKNLVERLTTT